MNKLKVVVVIGAAIVGAVIGFVIAAKVGDYGAIVLGTLAGAFVGMWVYELATD